MAGLNRHSLWLMPDVRPFRKLISRSGARHNQDYIRRQARANRMRNERGEHRNAYQWFAFEIGASTKLHRFQVVKMRWVCTYRLYRRKAGPCDLIEDWISYNFVDPLPDRFGSPV